MFGTSGIRGPVGETVTADLALSVGRAVGVDAERLVVGRDPRDSGDLLVDALAAGAREVGCSVVDLGLAATPTVARAVSWYDADAGASVTASHNPAPDNGIKLWQPSGQAFDAEMRAEITERVEEDAFQLKGWSALGARTSADATADHVAALVEETAPDALPVVVDLGNGAGGVTVEALTEHGCQVETLNAQPDGRFPGRPSEPSAENCASLCSLVAESDAVLGLAHDGDADRLQAVTEFGEFVAGDVLLALFAADAAEAGDRVAAPVDTSLAVEDYLAERGIEVERTPVGDTYVAAAATAENVAFGGEPSGAWIWPDTTLCPDGPLAACKLVELASERTLADRVTSIPTYPIRRGNVEVEDKEAVMAAVREAVLAEYDDVSTLDGVRVDVDDGWFLLRASGTQPLVRVTAEAREAERTGDLFEEARSIVDRAM